MTSQAPPPAPAMQNAPMEAKLAGMADALRRERDESHRVRLMAEERLRLVAEEAQALENAVKKLQDQYKGLQEKAGQTKTVKDLEATVAGLTKEVGFQHNELVLKREKLAQAERTEQEADQKRHDSVLQSKETLQRQHDLSVKRSGPSNYLWTSDKSPMEELQLHLDADVDGQFAAKWPRLVRTKTQWLTDYTTKQTLTSRTLRRVVDGYRDKLQLEISAQSKTPVPGQASLRSA